MIVQFSGLALLTVHTMLATDANAETTAKNRLPFRSLADEQFHWPTVNFEGCIIRLNNPDNVHTAPTISPA